MGRADVRAAVARYLTKGIEERRINFLGKVYPHPPRLTKAGEFYEKDDPGVLSGAVIYLHIREEYDERISIGPSNYVNELPGSPQTPAEKKVPYMIGMICLFRSAKYTFEEAGADNDSFLDSLVNWIRRDRLAGTGPSVPMVTNPYQPPGDGSGAVWQWGEGDLVPGQRDISVKAGMPKTFRGQGAQVFSTCDVMALEIIHT